MFLLYINDKIYLKFAYNSRMEEKKLKKKYSDYIENLIEQMTPVLPEDVNELQKGYLITNIRRASTKMAQSIEDNIEFSRLDFDSQCFYIQIIAEWSFHKEIDLFRSGIPPKYWKVVMQKIWFAMWEVMFACVKNDAPETVVLSLVERFVNRTYYEAVEELKYYNIIDDVTEIQAKEQSNLKTMAEEYRAERIVSVHLRMIIKRTILALIISIVVSLLILKFKTVGLITVITLVVVYIMVPIRRE